MKKPSSDLNDIIASLSKFEAKKYTSSNSPKQSAYLDLFKLIHSSRGRMTDEELQNALKKKGYNFNSFPRIKKYLYDSVLQYLATLENKTTTRYYLREQLLALEVLVERNLFTQADKLLNKLKTIAKNDGLEAQLLDLLYLESKIIYSSPSFKHQPERTEALSDDFNDLLNQIEISKQSVGIKIKSKTWVIDQQTELLESEFSQKNPGLQRKIENLINSLPNTNFSNKNKADLYYLLGINAFIDHEFHKSIPHYMSALKIFEENDSFVQTHVEIYIPTVNNLCDAAVLVKDRQAFHHGVRLLKDFSPKTDRAKLLVGEMKFSIVSRAIATGYVSAEDYTFASEKYFNFIIDKNLWIYTNIFFESVFDFAVSNFFSGNFSNTRRLIEYYYREFKPDKDRRLLITILELMIALEKEEFELVESRLRVLLRLLDSRHPLFEIYSIIARPLKENELHLDKLELAKIKMHENQHNVLVRMVVDKLHFISWLNSKINISNPLEEFLRNNIGFQLPLKGYLLD
jgi:hypothetical protein